MTTDYSTIKVAFPYRGGIRFFNPEQIVRLQSDSNYTHVYFTDQKPIMVARVLADYAAILEPIGFIRTHRSHLINKIHVTEIKANNIIMDDNSQAEISRRKRHEVVKTLVDQAA